MVREYKRREERKKEMLRRNREQDEQKKRRKEERAAARERYRLQMLFDKIQNKIISTASIEDYTP